MRPLPELLGSGIGGFEVREILVERRETLRAEIYVSVSLDSSAKAYGLTVCAEAERAWKRPWHEAPDAA